MSFLVSLWRRKDEVAVNIYSFYWCFYWSSIKSECILGSFIWTPSFDSMCVFFKNCDFDQMKMIEMFLPKPVAQRERGQLHPPTPSKNVFFFVSYLKPMPVPFMCRHMWTCPERSSCVYSLDLSTQRALVGISVTIAAAHGSQIQRTGQELVCVRTEWLQRETTVR